MARGICANCVHHSVGHTGSHRCDAKEYKTMRFDYVTGQTRQVGGESDGKVSCYVKNSNGECRYFDSRLIEITDQSDENGEWIPI